MEIIAEIGQNFNGDLALAKKMIQIVKECGADVAKFQVYDAKALFSKENNPWYDYNCKTELTKSDLVELFEECNKVGIEFMASVFDLQRVDWLEELNVKRYKTASRSIRDHDLISKLVATKKPLIVSLGMWGEEKLPEIKSGKKIDYLYCVSKYPTDLTDLHFNEVDFKNKYSGFSDHTLGITAPVTAMARGARIIEKHFTLDKTMYGPDHTGSMTPEELKQLVQFKKEIAQCL